jgi:hypothetical protein
VLDLKQAVEVARVEGKFSQYSDGSNLLANSPQIPKISLALERMGMIHLPHRQPSWCKEVSAAILIIGMIPPAWLSAADYANISRLITRASVEKQLVISTEELMGVFKLLFGFLQRQGRGCRDDAGTRNSSSSSRIELSARSAGSLVTHEIMRGMAQLLLIRNDRIGRNRLEILEVLIPYCDHRGIDLESRYAAIDAIGNVLAFKADADALLPPITGRHTGGQFASDSQALDDVTIDDEAITVMHENGELFSGTIDETARRAVFKRNRAEALVTVHEQCLQSLVDNFKAASKFFLEDVPRESLALPSKLLVSCLRALAQCITASMTSLQLAVTTAVQSAGAGGGDQQLPSYATPDVQRHTQSLIQSVFTIFDRILPPVTSSGDTAAPAPTPSSRFTASAGTISQALVAETKLWTHALKLLSVLAAYNPSTFMSNWPLFLVDPLQTENTLQEGIARLIAARETIAGINKGDVLIRADERIPSVFPKFRSSIFSAAAWAPQPAVRAAAVLCIKSMIKGLPLQRWFKAMRSTRAHSQSSQKSLAADASSASSNLDSSAPAKTPVKRPAATRLGFLGDKITTSVIKIFRFVVLLLTVERDEAVIQELLGAASALVEDMPLTVVHGSPRILILEDLAVLLFRQAMIIASENNSGSGGADAPFKAGGGKADAAAKEKAAAVAAAAARVGDASVHALHWLSDIW